MASCSRDSKYVGEHVFLSHSGKQKHFVRELYKDLTRNGVSCFFDESRESLPLGEEWARHIFEAAETCRIAVLFLSMDFIKSKWPMLELSAFVEAKYSRKNSDLNILPIFWNISTEYLKELTSNTQDIPEWRRLGILEETQTKWKEALSEVRKFNGLRFKEGENEENLRNEIIEGVLKLLPILPYSMPVDTVGLAERQQKVIELLQWTSKDTPPLAVVIYGFGGIGKTTLAEAVVAEIKPRHCARVNFDIESSKKHIRKMQQKIVKDLFPKRTKTKFTDCWEGRTEMTKAFKEGGNKPIFLFIDNVPSKHDLQELLPRDMRDLPNGSRILITTRDLGTTMFIEDAGIKRQEYVVEPLSGRHAKIFLLPDLTDRQRDNIQEEDVERILNVCKGVPLALKIVRGHFRTQGYRADNCNIIIEALGKGEQIKEEDLSRRLTDFVYDQLEEPIQQAFLDICCFFNDINPFYVECIVGAQALTSLSEKAFVRRSDDKKTLIVHDIIRERGRKKAESTRIMNVESLIDAANEKRLHDIRGVWLKDEPGCVVEEQHLKAMKMLRVLALGKRTNISQRCERTFKDLIYLEVGGDIPCLPVNLGGLPKLKFYEGPLFKKGFSMYELPKDLRVLIPARQSDFKESTSSEESTSIRGVVLPEEVCQLNMLTELTLSHWTSLTCLPESLSKLKALKGLNLSFCTALKHLPESLSKLEALERLDLKNCTALQCLPESFGELKALKDLNLSDCSKELKLPKSIGKLNARIEASAELTWRIACVKKGCPELENSFAQMYLASLPEEICKDVFAQLDFI